jgi:hypothetical protein
MLGHQPKWFRQGSKHFYSLNWVREETQERQQSTEVGNLSCRRNQAQDLQTQ